MKNFCKDTFSLGPARMGALVWLAAGLILMFQAVGRTASHCGLILNFGALFWQLAINLIPVYMMTRPTVVWEPLFLLKRKFLSWDEICA